MKPSLFTFLFMLFISHLFAQRRDVDLKIKVKEFKALLTAAYTMTPNEAFGLSEDFSASIDYNVNDSIATSLIEILQHPEIVNYDLDTLLQHPFLSIVHSSDQKFWFLSWYDNNGGTWQIIDHVVCYFTSSNQLRIGNVEVDAESDIGSQYAECASSGWIDSIYKLPAKDKQLYLCVGGIKGCSSCCSDFAYVVELKDDELRFDYPAFPDFKIETEWDDHTKNDTTFIWSPCLGIDGRCEDLELFQYDASNRILRYKYTLDDLNGKGEDDENSPDSVSGQWYFDGEKFEEK